MVGISTDERSPAEVVGRRLKAYSDRGVFQGWRETCGRSDTTVFRFRWLLGSEFSLIVDPGKHQIVVKDLLPAVVYRSFMDSDLRRFVADRTDSRHPPHRRVASDVVRLTYTNRKQSVSLVAEVEENQYETAIKAVLTLLNDLFAHLNLYHIDYLHRNFGVPEE